MLDIMLSFIFKRQHCIPCRSNDKKVSMSINLMVERIVGVNRTIVEELEGIGLEQAYRNLWKTGFCQGAYVLDLQSNMLKTTRRVFKEPCLETATYTSYKGNNDDLNVLLQLAYVHYYVQAKRMGVIRTDNVPTPLFEVTNWIDRYYDPSVNNENTVLNAFLHTNDLSIVTGMSRADRETAVRMLHVQKKTPKEIRVHFGLIL